MTDPVNKPAHYTQGGIECIEAIEASMTATEFRGFLKGNVAKYLWRYNNKGKASQDLAKASWYLNLLKERVETQERAEAVLSSLKYTPPKIDIPSPVPVSWPPLYGPPMYGPAVAQDARIYNTSGVAERDGPEAIMPLEKAKDGLRRLQPKPPLYMPTPEVVA